MGRLPRGRAGWGLAPGRWPVRVVPDARVIASGPVRPSSAAQPWMCGQRRCPSCRSGSAAVSARIIAVMAVLRSRSLAGQPGHLPGVLAAGRRPGGVRGLVAGHGGVGDGQGHGGHFRVGVMVRLPGLASGSAGGRGRFPGLRPGTAGCWGTSRGAGRPRSSTSGRPCGQPVVGERQVVGFLHFGQVLLARPRGRDRGRWRPGGGFGVRPVSCRGWSLAGLLVGCRLGLAEGGYAVPGAGCRWRRSGRPRRPRASGWPGGRRSRRPGGATGRWGRTGPRSRRRSRRGRACSRRLRPARRR